MKTVVIPNDISIPGVVNDRIYQQYTELLKKDILRSFGHPGVLRDVDCPGCSAAGAGLLADVMGMTYKTCANCGSYFVSPRPRQQDLQRFYQESDACRYWRQEMAALDDTKLYYIYGPKEIWLTEWVDECLGPDALWMDYQTKYSFLIKHIQAQRIFHTIKLLSSQLFEQQGSLPDDLYLSQEQAVALSGQVDMLTAFESLERAADPAGLIKLAHDHCRPGGLFLFTTATSSGFEYQVLKRHAPNLNPINRLNLLSQEALVNLLEQTGFEILELSTPGRLDVEIVKGLLDKGDVPGIDPFWKYIFRHRPSRTMHALQDFLQENRLSSHARIVARKKP